MKGTWKDINAKLKENDRHMKGNEYTMKGKLIDIHATWKEHERIIYMNLMQNEKKCNESTKETKPSTINVTSCSVYGLKKQKV